MGSPNVYELGEQQLEDQCIAWFQQAGWCFAHGPDIAPEGAHAERADFRQVVLRDRLLAALARINPHIPAAALEDAAQALLRVSEPLAVVRNRAVHPEFDTSHPNLTLSSGKKSMSDMDLDAESPADRRMLVVALLRSDVVL
jgi:type I restriction enzyme R subunit